MEAVGKSATQYANESMKGVDGASQKARELVQNVPNAANLPTLDDAVTVTFGIIEVVSRRGLGLPSFMHEVTLPDAECGYSAADTAHGRIRPA